MLEETNFIHIGAWMVTQLKLKGTELLVYAIIYGYSQGKDQYMTGGIRYIMEFTQTSKPTVIKAIDGLIDKGLIEKNYYIENNVRKCRYRVVETMTSKETLPVKNFNQCGKETLPYPVKKLNLGGKETLPKNNKGYNNEIKDIKSKPVKHKYGEFKHVALTDVEYERLVNDYGEQAVLDGIENVDRYMEKSGRKAYNNYNLVLRDWGIKSPKLQKPKPKKNKYEGLDKVVELLEDESNFDAYMEDRKSHEGQSIDNGYWIPKGGLAG